MRSALNENFAEARSQGKAFVAWRSPGKQAEHLASYPVPVNLHNFENPGEGFLFCPFDDKRHKAWFLGKGSVPHTISPEKAGLPAATSHSRYTGIIREAISLFSRSFNKVVLARIKGRPVPPGFDPLTFFEKLCAGYGDAFVYFISLPSAGIWLGATPELLLNWDQQELKTVSLAGTRWGADQVFGNKEKVEQEIVTDYLTRLISNHGGQNLHISKQKLVKSGHLEHLFNEISFQAEGGDNAGLAFRLLEWIHPTPAVCGNPRESALEFISSREDFDRGYYSGFLGPLNEGSGSMYVNLRCMQVFGDQVVLYAGAGITSDSDPQKEWEETENKMQVLESLLQLS
jgi:isochorismate synthase